MQQIIIIAIPVLFAITVHEVAHGWMAYQLGDPTAKMLGRVTLNPFKHIDPIGTILVPAMLIYMSMQMQGKPLLFGWAKPVPVTWNNLGCYKRDTILVALAGPGVNLIMAVMWAVVYHFSFVNQVQLASIADVLIPMSEAGILVNIVLMVLNLLPLPPLDGSRVVSVLLPQRLSWQYGRLEPYGFIILIALLVTGVLGKIMAPMIHFFEQLIGSFI